MTEVEGEVEGGGGQRRYREVSAVRTAVSGGEAWRVRGVRSARGA